MPETKAAQGDVFAALKRKVGPLPLGVWLAAGLGIWWYMRKQQEKQAAATQQQPTGQTTGYGTDPAGNTGYIDPSTGYVYGSAEDVAALQSQGLVGANQYNTGGAGDTSGTGAAGTSIDTGTGAMTAPSGTAVSTPGAPPGATSAGGGAAPAAGGKSWHYPAPSGLTAHNVTAKGFHLRWNAVSGPGGQRPSSYTVAVYQMNGKKVDQWTARATDVPEYGAGGKGLHPGWQYRANVWANGGPVAPPHASVVVTLKAK